MKLKLKLRFSDPDSENNADSAFIDVVDKTIRAQLQKHLGRKDVYLTNDGKKGLLALRILKNILDLYMIYSDSTVSRMRAREEWEEIEKLIGVRRYLEYLEQKGELKDLAKHLKKLAKDDKEEAQHLWDLLTKKEL